MSTSQEPDKDDKEANAVMETLEHQIADITELNEPTVTWDGETQKGRVSWVIIITLPFSVHFSGLLLKFFHLCVFFKVSVDSCSQSMKRL